MFSIGLFPSGLFGVGLFFQSGSTPPPPPPPPPPTAIPFQDRPRGRLVQVDGWNKAPGQIGAQRKYSITTARERVSWESIDNDDGCAFAMSPLDEVYGVMEPRDILVYWYDQVGDRADVLLSDARFDVFRFSEIDKLHGPRESLVKITGRGRVFDLASTREISKNVGGFRQYEFTDSKTPYDWIVQYVIPALQEVGITDISVGDVEPLTHVSLVVSFWNGLRTMNELAAAIPGEWQLRHDGLNGFRLDVRYEIGSDAGLRGLREGRNLPRLRVRSNSIPMLTQALAVGAQGHSSFSKTIQGLRWKIGAVNPGASSVELVAIDGSAVAAIREAGQYTTATGLPYAWSLVNVRTGRAHTIQTTTPNPSVCVLDTLGTLAIGDEVELREGVAVPRTYRVDEHATGNVVYPRRVSGVSGNDLTLVTLQTGDPVPTNDLHLDDRMEVSSFVVQRTLSNMVEQSPGVTRFTVDDTTSLAVGQWGFASSASAEPWGGAPIFSITAIVSATQFDGSYKHAGFLGAPYTAIGAYTKVRIYALKAASPFVNDEVASTNVVTVSSATGISTNDVVEYYRAPLADLASYIPAGAAHLKYGPVGRPIVKDQMRGEHNLLALGNPLFEQWTGSAGAPPDGYVGGGGTTFVKATKDLVGPASIYNMSMSPGSVGTPVCRILPTQGTRYVHGRVWLQIPDFLKWTGNGRYVAIQLVGGRTGQVFVQKFLYPTNATVDPAPGLSEQVDSSAVVTVTVSAELLPSSAGHPLWNGIAMYLQNVGTGGQDVVASGGFMLVQSSSPEPPDDAYFVRYADGLALYETVHTELEASDTPDTSYEAGVIDIARLDLDAYPEELRKGVPVVIDHALAVAGTPSLRVVRVERHHDRMGSAGGIGDTRVTLDRLPDNFVKAVAKSIAAVSSAAGQ